MVKEATLDLAVNFPGQLCTHWIDVSVRALVAERYTTQLKDGGSLPHDGRGGQTETLQGQGASDGHGDVRETGPRAGEGAQPLGDGSRPHSEIEAGAARVARPVCDSGCGPAVAGQGYGAGGAMVRWWRARILTACFLVRALCLSPWFPAIGLLMLKESQTHHHHHHHHHHHLHHNHHHRRHRRRHRHHHNHHTATTTNYQYTSALTIETVFRTIISFN